MASRDSFVLSFVPEELQVDEAIRLRTTGEWYGMVGRASRKNPGTARKSWDVTYLNNKTNMLMHLWKKIGKLWGYMGIAYLK